jgi:hypothetical protein
MIAVLLSLVLTLSSTPQTAADSVQPVHTGRAHLLIFVTSDCPISNFYASDIQDVCRANRSQGLTCSLVYEDAGLDEERMRAHLAEYGYRDLPAVIDRDRAIARRVGATVTPQVVLSGTDGRIRYRGRIDNRYAALGKPRRVVTEHDLRDAIADVLAGRPVRTPEPPALGCYIVTPEFQRRRP